MTDAQKVETIFNQLKSLGHEAKQCADNLKCMGLRIYTFGGQAWTGKDYANAMGNDVGALFTDNVYLYKWDCRDGNAPAFKWPEIPDGASTQPFVQELYYEVMNAERKEGR